MIQVNGQVSLLFIVVIITNIAAAIESNLDGGNMEITQTRFRRSIWRGAGEIIGKTLPKLPLTVQTFAHYLRARSVLKADATFFKKNRIYEKRGGLGRANFNFHRMDVNNVKLYKSDAYGLVKKGTVGDGWTVRLMLVEGQEPQIILSKLNSAWQRTSTMHVRYMSID